MKIVFLIVFVGALFVVGLSVYKIGFLRGAVAIASGKYVISEAYFGTGGRGKWAWSSPQKLTNPEFRAMYLRHGNICYPYPPLSIRYPNGEKSQNTSPFDDLTY